MGGYGFGEASERGDILRRSSSAAAVVRMSIIENPEHAHLASAVQRAAAHRKRKRIAAAPFDVRPQHVHSHKCEAGVVGQGKRAIVAEKVDIHSEARLPTPGIPAEAAPPGPRHQYGRSPEDSRHSRSSKLTVPCAIKPGAIKPGAIDGIRAWTRIPVSTTRPLGGNGTTTYCQLPAFGCSMVARIGKPLCLAAGVGCDHRNLDLRRETNPQGNRGIAPLRQRGSEPQQCFGIGR